MTFALFYPPFLFASGLLLELCEGSDRSQIRLLPLGHANVDPEGHRLVDDVEITLRQVLVRLAERPEHVHEG